MELKRQYDDKIIIEWLNSKYSDNFHANFYDPERTELFDSSVAQLAELGEKRKSAKDATEQLFIDFRSSEIINSVQKEITNSLRLSDLGVIGLLLNQVTKHEKPNVPLEFWEYLENQYDAERRKV